MSLKGYRITCYMQSDNARNSLTEHIQSVMEICQIETEQIQQLSTTLTSNFQNFPEPTLISRTVQGLK